MAWWVIWFIETATEVITGTAVTLGQQSSRTPLMANGSVVGRMIGPGGQAPAGPQD
ncbi:hypothetical protein [Streptomyces sp900116325]|uniref:hypothetical protein n=1 Tax=Streptomyces sp. 900116325 TaxID=3154295 RepID=UPI0033D0F855